MSQQPPDLLGQMMRQRMEQRRYSSLRTTEVLMPNYLSFLVWLAMMGVGYLLFFRGISTMEQVGAAHFGMAFVWFLLSSIIASSIKIAAQWEKALVFRLGKFQAIKGPGVFMIIPMIDSAQKIDTRILTMDIPRQEAITKDNVPISIDGVIFMQVVRPDQAIINVQDFAYAITQYAQTALRDVIGGRTLDEVLSERESIGHSIEQLVEEETEHWGLKVAGIRIQDILLPEDLKKVMSRQASAEREKRANITKSEGDRLAAENLAAAAKTMATSPGAMQLRTLQTIDGLGPTASNTVILGIPLEVMELVESLTTSRRAKQA